MAQYKITAERNDVPRHQVDTFTVNSDEEARKEFEKIKNTPRFQWDHLTLLEFHERIVENSSPESRKRRA